ncbi:MAG: hypothetical protein KJO07_21050, partial [Deltaproteobacteria bacterium]|nr:hypothetical protein [Deltaproteobacteria bacterium]
MRALAAIVLALGFGCGGGQGPDSGGGPQAAADSYQIAPVFNPGSVYRVRSETGSIIQTASAHSEAIVVMESTREVSAGGAFRQAPLRWRERVDRISVSGDKSWDSEGSNEPQADLVQVAALAGSAYTVDIDARGIAKVSNLDLPMPKLSEEQRAEVRNSMGDTEKVASGLAASVVTSLSSMPNRTTRVGESWTHESRNPSLGPDARVEMTWTLTSVKDGQARFTVVGRYRADALDQGKVEGHATFDLERKLFSELDMTTKLVLKTGS